MKLMQIVNNIWVYIVLELGDNFDVTHVLEDEQD